MTAGRLPSPRRRRLLGLLAAAGPASLGLAAPLHAHQRLPVPASLADELAAARARRRALVVLVSLEGCPFCRFVREHHLIPLRRDGQPVVEIDMRSSAALVDPAGARRTQAELARSLGVKVAPTVLFLGPGGRELAPRLEGASIPDFYGAYLDERLRTANHGGA